MKVCVRWWSLLACLLCGLAGFVVDAQSALAEAAEPTSSGMGDWALEDPLVVPGMQLLYGGQEIEWELQARRMSPEAVVAREVSGTAYSRLGATQARSVLGKEFAGVVDDPAGGLPRLSAGARLAGYLNADTARVVLKGGRHVLIESGGVMARPSSDGGWVPVDLALRSSDGSYVPASAGAAVRIPGRLGEGVRASGSGVSLTPVDAGGAALGGSGSVDGTGVFYANTLTDTDTFVKPTAAGFELSAILRSVDSPRVLYYRVGLPTGARLVRADAQGPVRVMWDGTTLAIVMPPGAVGAAGESVPVRMRVRGDLLVVEVAADAGDVQWPLDVDPELATTEDRSLTGAVWPSDVYEEGANWQPVENSHIRYEKHYSCGLETYWCEQSWYMEPSSSYGGGEAVGVKYGTQGESRIYKLEAWASGWNEYSNIHSSLEIRNAGYATTNSTTLSEGANYRDEPATVCAEPSSCEPSAAPEGDFAVFANYTTKSGSAESFYENLSAARVYVAQEKGPETSFNTTSEKIASAENRPNVLYGGGGWLSPSSGAYEVKSHDPGVGVSRVAVDGPGLVIQKFMREEGECLGVQCKEEYNTPVAYHPGMADGEDSIKWYAEDAMGLYGYVYATIKVDGTPPYNIGFTDMPEAGAEISAAQHKLTFSATDGKAPTPSSGVKSIAVSIDGEASTVLSGSSCSLGPCTASGEYTLHAENLSEGVHRLRVTATDNAGNVAAKEFFFDVRHASPVAVGPGSVDPTTGQFSLSANDVSMGGVVGVTRTYRSRELRAGVGGVLGPQWAVSLGSGESLTVLPEGSAMLAAANGGVTTFTRNEKGEYESPPGDGNLKMEAKEAEPRKGITEYLLSDANAGSTTHFTQPTESASKTLAYSQQFGSEAGQLDHPMGEAIDSGGNLWVADQSNHRVVKFSPAGAILGSYGAYGSGEGQFMDPWGIAINHSTGNVYVSDEVNDRVVELSSSGTFVRSFGSAGSGAGQLLSLIHI